MAIEHRPRRACSRSRARYVASAACPGCRPTRVTNAPSGVSGVMTGASLMTSTACLRDPARVRIGYEPYPTHEPQRSLHIRPSDHMLRAVLCF
jgi:hypothetical protein